MEMRYIEGTRRSGRDRREMTQANSHSGDDKAAGKGKAFFDRASQVAETGNWDFAIEMYLQGLQREPGNIERGHQPLRAASLQRTLKGGKAAGMMEQLKRRPGKDLTENLLNAEHLLAKEPGNLDYMTRVLEAAKKLELRDVVKWICDILMESQRQAQGKPSKGVLLTLTQAYHDIEEYGCALQACQMAVQLAPNDAKLSDVLKDLSAKDTIKKGGFGQEGFTQSIKDADRQKQLIQGDSLVQGKDYLTKQVERARQEYLASPTVPGKINGYVEALLKLNDEGFENEAVDVLTKGHKDTGAYQFKMKIGDIKMPYIRRLPQITRDLTGPVKLAVAGTPPREITVP